MVAALGVKVGASSFMESFSEFFTVEESGGALDGDLEVSW
jgi:hypothetical protein